MVLFHLTGVLGEGESMRILKIGRHKLEIRRSPQSRILWTPFHGRYWSDKILIVDWLGIQFTYDKRINWIEDMITVNL